MFIYQDKDNGVSVKAVLDTRRITQSGLYIVRIRVFHKSKYTEFSTHEEISKNDWELLPAAKTKQLKKSKQNIQDKFTVILAHVKYLVKTEAFSFTALNIRLQRNEVATLNAMMQKKINDLQNENRFGTESYYTNIFKAVERYKGNKVSFEDVDVDWLKGFEKFLLTEERKKSFTTIGMYMRGLRALFNSAIEQGLIKEYLYPFGKRKYEIPSGDNRKLALTVEQIGNIMSYTDGNPKTEQYRDLWVFSYLANGINFTDMLRLKFSNIINGDLVWFRQKTLHTNRHKKPIQAFITPEMQTIINRWGNTPKPDNYVFPYFCDAIEPKKQVDVVADVVRRVNRKMKYIGEQTGTGTISTYTARHSFATVLKRSGANIAFISESLGHRDLLTTSNYLSSFEQSERAKNAAFLTNFKTDEREK